MIKNPSKPSAVSDRDTVLACFEATATWTFAWICRLVAGDRDLAEGILADVYLQLQVAVTAQNIADVGDSWLMRAAFVLASDSCAGEAGMSVRDRALLALAFEQDRRTDEIAAIVGLREADVPAATTAAAGALGATGAVESVADVLRRSERWLDDTTRRRARSAIIRGERPRVRRPSPELLWHPPGGWTTAAACAPRQSATQPKSRSDDLRRPRRTTITIAAAAAALLAGGGLWISSGESTVDQREVAEVNRANSASPALSTTATVGQAGASSAASGRPELTLPPGYIIDGVDDGFLPVGVWEQADTGREQPALGWFELFADPGSSRTSGRWFAVATSRWSGYFGAESSSAATRIAIDGRSGVMRTSHDGVVEILVQFDSSQPHGPALTVTGNGLSSDELKQIAGAVVLDDQSASTASSQTKSFQFDPSADAVREGMDMIRSAPTVCCGAGPQQDFGGTRSVDYGSVDPTATPALFSVFTHAGPEDQELDAFLESASPDPLAPTNPQRSVQIGDRTVTVTGDAYFDGTVDRVNNSVRWTEGGETIRIAGEIDLASLLRAVASARPATAAEWRALAQSRPTAPVEPRLSERASGPPTYRGVGKSVLGDTSTSWQLLMSVDPDMITLINGSATWEEPLDIDPLHPVHEYTSINATVLVIALRDPGSGTAVRVEVAGRDPVTVALSEIDDSGVYAALDAFSELPPYTVELVDDAGTSVRLLTP